MKRSTINAAIEKAIQFFEINHFSLPDFAYFPALDWEQKGKEYDEIRLARLGWDVTDFGSGDFDHTGRTIFTLRNGKYGSTEYPKSYAEKVMCLREDQKSPIHYHQRKMEDIINHAGGNILISFWKATDTGISQEPVTVSVDGRKITAEAGLPICLRPGQSVCVTPHTYHQFYAQPGNGRVVSGEVSSVCDDLTDNFWLNKDRRFPEIEEDEPRKYLLCSEYVVK